MINLKIFKLKDFDSAAKLVFDHIINFKKVIIFITGNMGVGKTTFTNSFVRNFGSNYSNSASYSIISKLPGSHNIIHCDFYRYNPTEEFISAELDPLLGKNYILLIEWGHPQIMYNDSKHFSLEIILEQESRRNLSFHPLN